jgi:zinc protease
MRRVALLAGCLLLVVGCERGPKPIRYSSGIKLGVGFAFRVNYATYTMRNGLTVVLAPDEESNLVTVDVRYFVGAADEVAGKTGLAHMVEHLLFEVQPDGGPTLAARLGELALSYNANTTLDSTHYLSVGFAPQLEALLRIEAQRMTAGCEQLSDLLFEKEKAILAQEQAQRAEDEAPVTEFAAAVWGADHPFQHGVSGHDLAALTKDDACAFIARHYAPRRAALVIGGAISAKATLALVAKYFQPIPSGEELVPSPLPELPAWPGARTVQLAVDHPGAMLVFPLEPYGSSLRVKQDQVLALVQRELQGIARERDEVKGAGVSIIGSYRRPAVALSLSGSDKLQDPKLVEQIYLAIDRALKSSEHEVAATKAAAMTALLAAHDRLLARGQLIADYSQFTAADTYHGNDVKVLTDLDDQEVTRVGKLLLARANARVLYLDQRDGSADTFALAASGDARDFEVPPKPQSLSGGDPLMASLRQLRVRTPPEELRLKNGMRVVLVPRQGQGFFDARLWFPAGHSDDPPGLTGVAQLTADLLEPRFSDLEIGDFFALLSASLSGGVMFSTVGEHGTTFGIQGVSSLASMHLWRMHSMLESGEIDAASLQAMKKRATGAGKDNAKDDSSLVERQRQLQLRIDRQLFGANHPALRTHKRQLDKISVEDLRAFRGRHYRASGAVLVVAGSFDAPTIRRDIEELWGAWPARPSAPSVATPPMSPVTGPAFLALDRPDRQVSLTVRFAARSSDTKDAAVRAVAIELINARMVSLRERLAATYGIDLEYVDTWAGSYVRLKGRVASDRCTEVLQAIFHQLDMAHDDAGAVALEVAQARRKALQRALASATSTSAIVTGVLDAVQNQLPLDRDQRQISAVAAVTSDEVRALIVADFDTSRMVVSAEGPGASVALKATGAKAVEVIE